MKFNLDTPTAVCSSCLTINQWVSVAPRKRGCLPSWTIHVRFPPWELFFLLFCFLLLFCFFFCFKAEIQTNYVPQVFQTFSFYLGISPEYTTTNEIYQTPRHCFFHRVFRDRRWGRSSGSVLNQGFSCRNRAVQRTGRRERLLRP